MRFVIMAAACLALSGMASAQADPQPPLGQCRDGAGRTVACTSGAAATDAEAIPLAAKAKVNNDLAVGRTPRLASAASKMIPAHCRDGAYDVGRTRRAACARHAGVASPR